MEALRCLKHHLAMITTNSQNLTVGAATVMYVAFCHCEGSLHISWPGA